ncbi:hypothetical protein [Timonella senegalensis]|uniref:hypothetical protein n=1 Tax=Timonella senegalensis TaxID=1465825 RepID=UPI002FDDECD3
MLESARAHKEAIAALTSETLASVLTAWQSVLPANITGSWESQLPRVLSVMERSQFEAALAGGLSGVDTLAEQGDWVEPEYFTNPRAMVGYSSTGAPLSTALHRPVSYAKQLIGQGVLPGTALDQASMLLAGIVKTQVPDAARVSAGLDVTARPGVSYVRMVGGAACPRCIVLAGKVYRWNKGFLRHPRCNCVHIQMIDSKISAAELEGLIQDPYAVFKGLSQAEQDRVFGRHNAEALRDGADIYQVVNARRGRNGLSTTEGTSKRGYSSALSGRRLTPEGIYAKNLSREQTLELLAEHNYILPAGQVPGGSIRGQREGYGALGRGGQRIGARESVLEARRTGLRDPLNRYTMTEAERRLFDAEMRYKAVQEGRNPFTDKEPLTPAIAARVEKDYRRWLSTGGEVYIE